MAKVLLVDDELTMVQMVADLLREDGHEVFPFTNLAAAVAGLTTHQPDLVVTDLYLDKTNAHGLEIIKKARALSPPAVVIVITGYGSIDTAVDAMRNGAFDYLEKPFKVDELRMCIQRGLSYSTAVSETTFLRRQLKKKYHFSQIVGASAPMQDVFKLIERVANTDSTVLVLGESGTGKELVARSLHFNSRRQHAPFVPINCSALPEALLESELFGHRRGAFTGAIADKKGLFQEADGGTIFLDEVGSMSPLLQSRLLRVLQEKEVRRVGDNVPAYVDVRVVAAANEPLEIRIKEGTFREDLYYRLNVIPIHLPALRERTDDIPLLVAHFLKQKARGAIGEPFKVSRRAMEVLLAHQWPGNVRELENAIERATTLCETNILRLGDLPPSLLAKTGASPEQDTDLETATLPQVNEPTASLQTAGGTNGSLTETATTRPLDAIKPLKNYLREQEQSYLNRVMEATGGDKEQAALVLGVSLATLYRKLSGDDREP
ncbi:MAG TPA: sigma-54 dependent transcriptional regulator [Verrucomicrobiae bacterium]|nr:sigma-54 dependent transcriptional regulator [Verrucomicrobiae bacterium]